MNSWSVKQIVTSTLLVVAGFAPFVADSSWHDSTHNLLVFIGVMLLFFSLAACPEFIFQPISKKTFKLPKIVMFGFLAQVIFNFLAVLAKWFHVGHL